MVSEQFAQYWAENKWLRDAVIIVGAFVLAWFVHAIAWRVTGRFVSLDRFTGEGRRMRPERRRTLHGLIANAVTMVAFIVAILITLSRFVSVQSLIWVVGLFSAAFGLGARPLVNDFLAGISFIFEDTFDVGEKVEILGVEGVIERVTLRITMMRAPTGELYVVPNGDIRVVRNFSRGRFSQASVTLKLAADDLGHALEVLEPLGKEAMLALPNLLEPWQIISESGTIGGKTELTLITKARFGHAAEMRPRLLAFVQEHLSEQGISLAD